MNHHETMKRIHEERLQYKKDRETTDLDEAISEAVEKDGNWCLNERILFGLLKRLMSI